MRRARPRNEASAGASAARGAPSASAIRQARSASCAWCRPGSGIARRSPSKGNETDQSPSSAPSGGGSPRASRTGPETCERKRSKSAFVSSSGKWSAEALSRSAASGRKARIWRELSSTSATQSGPSPRRTAPVRAGPAQLRQGAPFTTVGARPAQASRWPRIAVVVDLPQVPATATSRLRESSAESSSARRATGTPRRRAAARSGLSSSTATEATTRAVAGVTPEPSWGKSATPCARSAARAGTGSSASRKRSEPVTASPASRRASARADMPVPAMPTRWTGRCTGGAPRSRGVAA